MTIFHIPSWYPSKFHTYSGIFIKEYIDGYALEYPNSLNIISNHLENYYPISFKEPLNCFKNIKKYFQEKNNIKATVIRQANLIELYTNKTLGLSPNIFNFKKTELIKLHRDNLEYCIKKYCKPDLIHSYITFPAGEIGYELSKKYKIPYIITEHLGPFIPKNILKNGKLPIGIAAALKNASAVIGVSNSQVLQSAPFIDRSILVIPNGINENLFFPDKSFSGSDNQFTFLTVASTMHNSKGIDTLLNAIKINNDRGVKSIFKIGGSEKFLLEAKALAKNLCIENVIWFGMLTRTEISKEMKQCNAFVLASKQESFGVVYAEAIACGKPIIATECGGPEDIVNEQNGLLVPVGDIKALATAIEKMIINYKQYDSKIIRQDFLERFSRKVITNQYHHLYSNIIELDK